MIMTAAATCDLIIAIAYFSIPVEILTFWYRKNLRMSYFTTHPTAATVVKALVGLFGAFILLCGLTHLIGFLGVMNIQHHEFANLFFKMATAAVSVLTTTVLAFGAPLLLEVLATLEVTKRGLPDEALARNEMIMRHSLDVISTHENHSGSCSFISVSASVSRLTGYNVEEMVGKSLFDFVSAEDYDRVVSELRNIIKSHRDSSLENSSVGPLSAREHGPLDKGDRFKFDFTTTCLEYHIKCKDGTLKLVETGVSSSGSVLVLVTRNVGGRKAQELEKRERENLQMSMAVRQQYISSIAHDLKTPISTFQLALDLISGTRLDEEQTVLITQAKVATEFMSVTIFQAMDFARMTLNGSMTTLLPRKTPTDLRTIIDKCAAVLDGYPKTVPISFAVSDKIAQECLCDGDWLWQMLINLLTNACKFTTTGCISVRVTIKRPPFGFPYFLSSEDIDNDTQSSENSTFNDAHSHGVLASTVNSSANVTAVAVTNVSTTDYEEEIRGHSDHLTERVVSEGYVLGGFQGSPTEEVPLLLFEVIDTGVGVSDERKSSLFQAFGQAQKFQSQGTGLGLYSVAQKALKLGGTYGLIDNQPCGSNFFFAVPYIPEEEMSPTSRSSSIRNILSQNGDHNLSNSSNVHFEAKTAALSSSHTSGATDPETLTPTESSQNVLGDRSRALSGGSTNVPKGGGAGSAPAAPVLTPKLLPPLLNNEQIHAGNGIPMYSSEPDMVMTTLLSPSARNMVTPFAPKNLSKVSSLCLEDGLQHDKNESVNGARDVSQSNLKEKTDKVTKRMSYGMTNIPVGQAHRKRSLLLVDDTKSVLTLLGKALNWWGFETVFAANGSEALEAMKARMFDLVISDVQMPVLDGFESIKRFRIWEQQHRVNGTMPMRQIILSTSANCDRADMIQCIGCGSDGFLPKPLSLSLLKTTLNLYLGDTDLRIALQDFSQETRTFCVYDPQGRPSETIVPAVPACIKTQAQNIHRAPMNSTPLSSPKDLRRRLQRNNARVVPLAHEEPE